MAAGKGNGGLCSTWRHGESREWLGLGRVFPRSSLPCSPSMEGLGISNAETVPLLPSLMPPRCVHSPGGPGCPLSYHRTSGLEVHVGWKGTAWCS